MSVVMSEAGERVVTPEQTRLFDGWSLPIMIVDRDMRFVYANTAYLDATHRRMDDIIGRKVFDCFPDTEARMAEVNAKFEATLRDGVTTQLDAQPFQLKLKDGTVRDLVWQATQDPVVDVDGRVVGMIQRAEDITRQAELQRRNEAIGYELNHRVKNIMAVVSSIARITGRNARNIDEFVRSFTARLSSMGRTNDMLAGDDWNGLRVRTILDGELAPYAQEQARTYALKGPDVRLSLEGTKDLSMVVHELATNAAKYGCLGERGGALDVSWARSGDVLTIQWREACDLREANVDTSIQTGFGTRLFDMLPYIDVERDLRPTGLQLTITVSGRDAFV